MSKRWSSIKEIEVCILCEILISKDELPGQKNCCEPPFKNSLFSRNVNRTETKTITRKN